MEDSHEQMGSEEDTLVTSPTWSVATVLTVLLVVSLLVERTIHRLSNWFKRTKRKPLYNALEKMKEELMLLGFMSLVLTATSRLISSICITSIFSNDTFVPCAELKIHGTEHGDYSSSRGHKHMMQPIKRMLIGLEQHSCKKGKVPFASNEVLEQLDRFVFVMAITHVSYSCVTMLLAIIKIHTWRKWEDGALNEGHNSLHDSAKMQSQSTFVKFHARKRTLNVLSLWVACFGRQFGYSVKHSDYMILRKAFIMNHNLSWRFDFHDYLVRSMEDEFMKIVGISVPLWGFVIGFMLFDTKGANLYFWIAFIPFILILLIGTKLQHIIATLTLEYAAPSGYFNPRDELFWFKKPELVLSLIHFVLFQNAFELATYFWFWWQFGYESCSVVDQKIVHIRLTLGFLGQFLCSYSTLPLHALVTQMGTNYKAAMVPPKIREMVHDWGAETRKRRKKQLVDEGSTIISIDMEHVKQSIEDHSVNEYSLYRHRYDERFSSSSKSKGSNMQINHESPLLQDFFETSHVRSNKKKMRKSISMSFL